MSRNYHLFPKYRTNWEQILKGGVICPRPEATKEDLWRWINDHRELINKERNRQIEEILRSKKDS